MGDLRVLNSVLAPQVRVFEYPGLLERKGRNAVVQQWKAVTHWPAAPLTFPEIGARFAVGNKVIHHHNPGRRDSIAAIYTVEGGRIVRIEYVRPERVH